jgi:hypothetical protein
MRASGPREAARLGEKPRRHRLVPSPGTWVPIPKGWEAVPEACQGQRRPWPAFLCHAREKAFTGVWPASFSSEFAGRRHGDGPGPHDSTFAPNGAWALYADSGHSGNPHWRGQGQRYPAFRTSPAFRWLFPGRLRARQSRRQRETPWPEAGRDKRGNHCAYGSLGWSGGRARVRRGAGAATPMDGYPGQAGRHGESGVGEAGL